jgi:signal transduction histidine kinase
VTTIEFPNVSAVPQDPLKILRSAAAELHDGVAQDLFAASMEVEELIHAGGLPPGVSDQLARIASNLHKSSLQLRGVLTGMFEGNLDRRGDTVVERLRSCVERALHRSDLTIDIRLEGTGPEPDPDCADLVVRSVREGLANVVKHADATEVLVIVRRGTTWWTVMVEDDGLGEAAVVRHMIAKSAGLTLGLASLVAEADRLGGRLWLSSAGRLSGVNLSISVPVRVVAEGAN